MLDCGNSDELLAGAGKSYVLPWGDAHSTLLTTASECRFSHQTSIHVL